MVESSPQNNRSIWQRFRNSFRRDNSDGRLKRYAKKTLAAGAIASAVVSGFFFNEYKNNDEVLKQLQSQKQRIGQRVDGISSNYNLDNKNLQEVIRHIEKEKSGLEKPGESYRVKQGDSLTGIAMELTGENDLDWAEDVIAGKQLSGEEKKTYETYRQLAKNSGKGNLFQANNWQNYGASKGYPVEGPNFLSKDYGALSLKGTPGYEDALKDYNKAMKSLNQDQETLQGLNKENSKLEQKIQSAKPGKWNNLLYGVLSLIPGIAYAGFWAGRRSNNSRNTENERTNNSDSQAPQTEQEVVNNAYFSLQRSLNQLNFIEQDYLSLCDEMHQLIDLGRNGHRARRSRNEIFQDMVQQEDYIMNKKSQVNELLSQFAQGLGLNEEAQQNLLLDELNYRTDFSAVNSNIHGILQQNGLEHLLNNVTIQSNTSPNPGNNNHSRYRNESGSTGNNTGNGNNSGNSNNTGSSSGNAANAGNSQNNNPTNSGNRNAGNNSASNPNSGTRQNNSTENSNRSNTGSRQRSTRRTNNRRAPDYSGEGRDTALSVYGAWKEHMDRKEQDSTYASSGAKVDDIADRYCISSTTLYKMKEYVQRQGLQDEAIQFYNSRRNGGPTNYSRGGLEDIAEQEGQRETQGHTQTTANDADRARRIYDGFCDLSNRGASQEEIRQFAQSNGINNAEEFGNILRCGQEVYNSQEAARRENPDLEDITEQASQSQSTGTTPYDPETAMRAYEQASDIVHEGRPRSELHDLASQYGFGEENLESFRDFILYGEQVYEELVRNSQENGETSGADTNLTQENMAGAGQEDVGFDTQDLDRKINAFVEKKKLFEFKNNNKYARNDKVPSVKHLAQDFSLSPYKFSKYVKYVQDRMNLDTPEGEYIRSKIPS